MLKKYGFGEKTAGCRAMFGYVRPQTGELRVREFMYYKSVYCGLCKSMERHISPLLSLSLRYDFVLLALVRMLLSDIRGEVVPGRCGFNPLRKKPVLADNEALRYSAACSALLLYYGVCDNIADEHGLKRLLWRMARLPASAMRRRALARDALGTLDETVRAELDLLAQAERAKESSPDAAAQPFGTLLGALFGYGLDGSAKRIAENAGMHVGRFIYLCDAADDAPEDEKSGAYNPFVCAAQREGLGAAAYLKQSRTRIETALRMECREALYAVQLAEAWETHPTRPCIENIFIYGMPAAAKHVLDFPGVPLSGADLSGTDYSAADGIQESDPMPERVPPFSDGAPAADSASVRDTDSAP